MSVFLVGAGPGDPDLLTVKALRLIQAADVILHDGLIDHRILDFAQKNCLLIDVAKRKGVSCFEQQQRIHKQLVHYAKIYQTVLRLKGGDPFVFGRGGEEILALAEAGLDVEVVPGITAGIAIPALAGIPVTSRGISSSLAFFSGHQAADLPDREIDWELATKVDTAVVFMGVKSLKMIIEKFIEYGKNQDTPIAIIERGSFEDQKEYIGKLSNILNFADGLKSPAIIIIGNVVNIAAQLKEIKNNKVLVNY